MLLPRHTGLIMTVVVSLNPNGTAAVTTPIARPGETETEAVARVIASMPGSEPLSATLVAALRAGDTAPNSPLPIAEFYARLAPVYLSLGEAADEVQRKWDRILGPRGPLSRAETIALNDPSLGVMLNVAIADGLLTEEQAGWIVS